jgi:la-related protein 1
MQGDKVRRQNDWHKWVIPRESNTATRSSSVAAPGTNVNNLTARLGGVALHESPAGGPSSTVDQNHHEVLLNGSTSSDNQAPPVAEESEEAEESEVAEESAGRR